VGAFWNVDEKMVVAIAIEIDGRNSGFEEGCHGYWSVAVPQDTRKVLLFLIDGPSTKRQAGTRLFQQLQGCLAFRTGPGVNGNTNGCGGIFGVFTSTSNGRRGVLPHTSSRRPSTFT